MTNQLKRAKREKLKKKQNNVSRNNLRSLHIDTAIPDKHAVSLFERNDTDCRHMPFYSFKT